jgi:hypothetical protein
MAKKKEEKYGDLLKKVEAATKAHEIDLSADEDLSVAVMNLVSIEEHLFFTGAKTKNERYFDLLGEVREMRKELMKRLIKDYEGEVWCISKHLLAASMRLIEVGTKELGKGNKRAAQGMFSKAYELYSLFWGINLEAVDIGGVKKIGKEQLNNCDIDKGKLIAKLEKIVEKIVDCCRE